MFIPSSLLVPPGGAYFTIQYIPNTSYTGPMDFWEASTNIPINPEEVIPCFSQGEFILPSPLCNDTSWTKSAARTAVPSKQETDAQHTFSLAPNPASQQTEVLYDLPQWTTEATGTIEIYDVRGALMSKYKVAQASGTQIVPTAKWSPSVYMVLIRVNDEVIDYKRLVIQR